MDQIIQVVADVLLGAGALGAAIYCIVLARRLKRFNNLENGVGGAVAVLSAQVDDMTKTLDQARKAAAHSSQSLTALTDRAEASARKLELMMASLHDLPDAPAEGFADAAAAEDLEDAAWTATASQVAPDAGDPPRFATRRQSTERARA